MPIFAPRNQKTNGNMEREEQLKLARQLLESGVLSEESANAIKADFPELAESEDERIRKWLIEMVEEFRKLNPTNAEHNGNCSEAIAYLEKQKEQKPVQSDVEKEYVRILKSIVSDFIRDKKPKDTLLYQDIFDWLEGRHIEQKPAEWSEEDFNIRNNLADYLTGELKLTEKAKLDGANWLKSLRPSWKPSEEQMAALAVAKIGVDTDYELLESLYNDLKKL